MKLRVVYRGPWRKGKPVTHAKGRRHPVWVQFSMSPVGAVRRGAPRLPDVVSPEGIVLLGESMVDTYKQALAWGKDWVSWCEHNRECEGMEGVLEIVPTMGAVRRTSGMAPLKARKDLGVSGTPLPTPRKRGKIT
jgi:hypothetical protein